MKKAKKLILIAVIFAVMIFMFTNSVKAESADTLPVAENEQAVSQNEATTSEEPVAEPQEVTLVQSNDVPTQPATQSEEETQNSTETSSEVEDTVTTPVTPNEDAGTQNLQPDNTVVEVGNVPEDSTVSTIPNEGQDTPVNPGEGGDTPTPPGPVNPGEGGDMPTPEQPVQPNVSWTTKAEYPNTVFVTINNLSDLSGRVDITANVGASAFPANATGMLSLRVFTYDLATNKCKYIGDGMYTSNMSFYINDVNVLGGNNQLVVSIYPAINVDLEVGAVLDLATVTNTAPATPVAPAEEGVISVSNVSTTVVGADAFKTAKTNKEDVVVKAGDVITWTFDDKELQNTKIDFKPSVVVSNEKFDTVKTRAVKDGVFIDFTHSGELPGKADVSLNIGTEKYGTRARTLHLYYYNPKTRGYEYKQPVQYKNGIAKFDLKHCSTYVIVAKRFDVSDAPAAVAGAPASAQTVAGNLDKEPKTGADNSLAIVGMIAIVSLAVSVVTRKK